MPPKGLNRLWVAHSGYLFRGPFHSRRVRFSHTRPTSPRVGDALFRACRYSLLEKYRRERQPEGKMRLRVAARWRCVFA